MRFSLYFLFSGLLLAPWLMAATKVTEPSAKVRKALKLAPFYKKHVDVGGFSIVSSEKVSNYALLEAAYLINQMLEGREDLLAEKLDGAHHLLVGDLVALHDEQ